MYLLGAVRNAEAQKKFYPDWTCRFYVSATVPSNIIRQLEDNGAEIVVVEKDEGYFRNMYWRFLPAGEKGVDACIVRDADSRFGWREKRMVEEWLASGKGFHIIRDFSRRVLIPAGSWGVRGGRIPDMRVLVEKFAPMYHNDEYFLQFEIYPRIKHDVLIHSNMVQFPGETVVPTPEPAVWEAAEPRIVGAVYFCAPRELYLKYGIVPEETVELPFPQVKFRPRSEPWFLRRVLRSFVPEIVKDAVFKVKEAVSDVRHLIFPAEVSAAAEKGCRVMGKRIISFSLFETTPAGLLGAVSAVESYREFYPGWVCRFYVSPEIPQKIIRALEDHGAEIIVMENASSPMEKACWNILAAGDKDAEACIMRLPDSPFTHRERYMVEEWLTSGRKFHVIRESHIRLVPEYCPVMAHNAWGVRGDIPNARTLIKDCSAYRNIRSFLQDKVYPLATGDVLIHGDIIRFPGEKPVPLLWGDGLEEETPYRIGVPRIHFPREDYLKYGLEIERPRRAETPRFPAGHKNKSVLFGKKTDE